MIRFLFFSFILITIYSCKKFDHSSDLKLPSSCDLCDYADELNGTYEGTMSGIFKPFLSPPYMNPTTLIVNLEHVYLNKGPYIDSTIMFIKMTTIYPEYEDTSTRVVSFEDIQGKVKNYYYTAFNLTPDSIYIFNRVINHNGTFIYADYTGLRQ